MSQKASVQKQKMITLKLDYYIESARALKHLPKSHPCYHTHGHSFKITFSFFGPIDPQWGWLEDYHQIEKKLKPFLNQLDHKFLNDIKGLEIPTTETICIWLFEKIKIKLPLLSQISIKETHNSECIYPALT